MISFFVALRTDGDERDSNYDYKPCYSEIQAQAGFYGDGRIVYGTETRLKQTRFQLVRHHGVVHRFYVVIFFVLQMKTTPCPLKRTSRFSSEAPRVLGSSCPLPTARDLGLLHWSSWMDRYDNSYLVDQQTISFPGTSYRTDNAILAFVTIKLSSTMLNCIL